MDAFIYDPPGQGIRMEIKKAAYQPEHALRLDIHVQEPLRAYDVRVRITPDVMVIAGGQITPSREKVAQAVRGYLAQSNQRNHQ